MNMHRATAVTILLTWCLISSCAKTIHEADLFWPPGSGERPLPLGTAAQTIEITAPESITLRGWIVRNQDFDGSLIYFYGNDESVSWKLGELLNLAKRYRLNIVCLDYRGYGLSDGKPSAEKLHQDALLVYDTMLQDSTIAAHPVLAFGRSLGSAIAIYLSSQRTVDGMILEAPLTSLSEIVPRMRSLVPWYARWLVRLRPDDKLLNLEQPADQIARLATPLLFIYGEKDELVPVESARRMFDSSPARIKRWCSVPGAGHFDIIINSPTAVGCFQEFLNSTLVR